MITAEVGLVDQDISGIIKQIGLEASKIVLEKIRDELVSKKNSRD